MDHRQWLDQNDWEIKSFPDKSLLDKVSETGIVIPH